MPPTAYRTSSTLTDGPADPRRQRTQHDRSALCLLSRPANRRFRNSQDLSMIFWGGVTSGLQLLSVTSFCSASSKAAFDGAVRAPAGPKLRSARHSNGHKDLRPTRQHHVLQGVASLLEEVTDVALRAGVDGVGAGDDRFDGSGPLGWNSVTHTVHARVVPVSSETVLPLPPPCRVRRRR